MRGRQSLFTDIFPASLKPTKRQTLLAKRDRDMAHRYYYHVHLCRLRYDDVLMNLSDEFYLTPDFIVERLSSVSDLLKEIVAKQPSLADLRKALPHFSF